MSQLPPPVASDHYRSIDSGPQIQTKVKGSTFLGQAFQIRDGNDVTDVLTARRKRYHDATHHCSAYRIGPPERSEERAEDDGEPSGTAGAPILGAIHRAELFDLLVVVTRYFGGVKLGSGGLVRAYGEAAREAVEAAPGRPVWRESRLSVSCGYEDIGAIEAVLAREADQVRSVHRTFGPQADFLITVLRSQAGTLAAILTESTSGRTKPMVEADPSG